MIFSRRTLGVALFAGLFAACSAPQPARADDTLVFALGATVPALMDTLDLVAEGAGYYKAEHLIVRKQLVNSAPEAARLCASGVADICPLSMEPLLSNYANGLRLQLFLARESHYSYVLSVPAESTIKTLADFKGAVIGAHIIGASSSGEIAAKSMLQTAGIAEGDVSFVAIGYENDALNAILSKRVAGAAFPLYELIPYQVAGHNMRIFEHPTLKDVANAGYCAAPATIEAKADQLARWSRAIVKASLFVRYNPAASARIVLAGPRRAVHRRRRATDGERAGAVGGRFAGLRPSQHEDRLHLARRSGALQ